MDDDDIKAARAVIAAATPGPWTVQDGSPWGDPQGILGALYEPRRGRTGRTFEPFLRITRANKEFAAAARTGWPAALDALEQARAELAAEREAHEATRRLIAQAEASERGGAKMLAAMYAQRLESDRVWKRDCDSSQAAHRETRRLLAITEADRDTWRDRVSDWQEKHARRCAELCDQNEATRLAITDRDAWKARAEAAEGHHSTFQCGECGRFVADRDLAAPCPYCRLAAAEKRAQDAEDARDAALVEPAQLRADLAVVTHERSAYRSAERDASERLAVAEKRIEALSKVASYADHLLVPSEATCRLRLVYGSDEEAPPLACTCGLDAARKEAGL